MGILLRFFIFLQLFDVVKVARDESTIQRLFASAIVSLNGLIASISHDLCFHWLLGRIGLGCKNFWLSLTNVVLNSPDVSLKSSLNHVELLFHSTFWLTLLFKI